MLKHIVLVEFKNELSKQEIHAVFQALNNLCAKIPEVLSYSYGKNISQESLNKNYAYGFVMDFHDAAACERYLQHPEHERVAEQILFPALKNGWDSALVFDYEFNN